MTQDLHAATDFGDEIIHTGRCYDRRQVDALMAGLAGLGVRHLEWIYHCWLAYADDYAAGFDLEAEAIRAAHCHGLTVTAVIKPFEVLHDILPHMFPLAPPACWNSTRGLFFALPPLAAARPDLCLKRRPGAADPGGPLTAIRLLKNNDRPSGLRAEDLSIWTSRQNGTWTRYEKPFRLETSVAVRAVFPQSARCRVLTLSGLDIPADQRYVEVRTCRPDPQGEFVNDVESIIELAGADGGLLPQTPPALLALHGRWLTFARSPAVRGMFRPLRGPELDATLADGAMLESWAADMRAYGHKGYPIVPYDFSEIGRVSAARGVDDAMPILHPIYPEVRAYWLGKARRFLDLGADGIDFRHCMHFRQSDLHEYGFNAPVLERTGGSLSRAEVARVNGAAYTQLLREAAALAHARGKRFGVHVSAELLSRADENRVPPFPRNFDFPWQDWLREFADFAVFRGAMGYCPANTREIVDRISLVCREAGKPLIYQSNRRQYAFDGPLPVQDAELEWVARHPDVAAYQLYETASFTRLSESGQLEFSPAVRDLVRRHHLGTGARPGS